MVGYRLLVACAVAATPVMVRAGVPTLATETPLSSYAGPPGPIVPFGPLTFAGGTTFVGTSYQGGTGTACGFGCGTVYALTVSDHAGHYGATTSVLYNFQGNGDGSGPQGGVVIGPGGVLYGTTTYGGANQNGTVFALTREGAGWAKTDLHDFTGADGGSPTSPLLLGSDGALYGVAGGGQFGEGVVFQLKPGATQSAPWSQRVLYSFPGGDGGQNPSGGLVGDPATALYGTTRYGGSGPCTRAGGVGVASLPGCGTVFSVTQPTQGDFTTTLLYSFQGGPRDGNTPGPLSLGGDGILYGAAYGGGFAQKSKYAPWGCGAIYSLTAGAAGAWTENVLWILEGDGSPACNPTSTTVSAPGELLIVTSPQDADTTSGVFVLKQNSTGWQNTPLAENIGPAATSPAIVPVGRDIIGANPYGGAGDGGAFLLAPP